MYKDTCVFTVCTHMYVCTYCMYVQIYCLYSMYVCKNMQYKLPACITAILYIILYYISMTVIHADISIALSSTPPLSLPTVGVVHTGMLK